MLISTKGRYGVMIMVYLAGNYNKGHKNHEQTFN